MKNKKLFNTIIILIWTTIVAFLVAKIFFGEYVAIAYSNPFLVKIGQFIDNHFWLKRFCYFLTTFVTYYLYLCACCQVWKLKWKQLGIITPILLVMQVVKYFEPTIGGMLDYAFMLACPYFLGAKYKTVIYIFTAHTLSQLIVGYARNIPVYAVNMNFMTMFLLGIDAYLWLILYYVYSNKLKGDNNMGEFMPPIWGDNKDFYEKELAKTEKKISECKNDKELEKLVAYKDCVLEKLKEFKD